MHYFFFVLWFCRDFLCWCVFYFGWLIVVDFGRFGLVGSVCVLCCDGAERSVLVLLRLWDFVRVGFGILMATILWCRGKRWFCNCFLCNVSIVLCLLLFLYCDFCVDVCIRIIDFFVSWCRVDVFLICVLCRCVGSIWFCVLDLCWCVSLVLWCKCVHSFYINNRLSILAWCDVDAFIAFFVVNIGSVVWCFSIRRLGAVCICS